MSPSPTVLHIEDDAANRLLVRKLLSRAGYRVIEASNGLEGVRMACEARPDLVLVDLNIPGLDGFEVTLRLRGEPSLRGVPIVAITAEGDRETSLAVGCDGFLQKPIDAKNFAGVIGAYLEGAREEPLAPASTRLREQSQRIVAHLEQKVAELSTANARLRELGQARTEFYRNVSHELATPMTPIVGYVKMLADEELGPLNHSQRKALTTMDGCVQRLRDIIDNLLDVTALETGRVAFQRRSFDVMDPISRAIGGSVARFEDAKIRLVEELPEEPQPAIGDPARLLRAAAALLDNAAKFSEPGSSVGLRLRSVGDGYELCVADLGPGVPEERAERIFDPFFQVDGSVTRRHGGVGVGLSIARRMARGMGGDVRVVSPCDVVIAGERFTGSAFYLTIARESPP